MPTASPAYDATEVQTWRFGTSATADTPASSVNRNTQLGISGTAGYAVSFNPWRPRPGTYTLKNLRAGWRGTTSTHCTEVDIGIWRVQSASLTRSDGDTFELVYTVNADDPFLDLATTNVQNRTFSFPADTDITVESGYIYYFGFIVRGLAADHSYPGFGYLYDNPSNVEVPSNLYQWAKQTDGKPTDVIYYDDATDVSSAKGIFLPNGSNTTRIGNMCAYLEVETTVRTPFVLSSLSGSSGLIEIPVCTSTPYYVVGEDVNVVAGDTLTMDYRDSDPTNVDEPVSVNINEVNMGATDKITSDGNDVNLNGSEEAGHNFDLFWMVDVSGTAHDLFYTNFTKGQGTYNGGGNDDDRDICTFSHASKFNNSFASEYTLTNNPYWIKLSGTGTIDTLSVCVKPMVLLGDSQGATQSSDVIPWRLGKSLLSSFTHSRPVLLACIPGGIVAREVVATKSTPLYLRFKGAAATEGALSEMRGALFVYVGAGVNDITQHVSADAKRNGIIAEITQRVSEMASIIFGDDGDRDNELLIIGLPPYANGSAAQQGAVSQLNRALKGVAESCRCVFHDPFNVVNADTDTHLADGIHYVDATADVGAELIASLASAQYESGKMSRPVSNIGGASGVMA